MRNAADNAWVLSTMGVDLVYCAAQPSKHYGWIPVALPACAAEPDDLKALVLAVRHVLEKS